MRSDLSMLSVKITFFGFCIVFMDCIYFYQILVHRRFRVFLSWHTMFPFSHSFLFIKSRFFISTACIACIFSVTPRLLWWRSFIRRQGTFGCFSHCWGCQQSVLDRRFNRKEQIGTICFYIVRIFSVVQFVLKFSLINKTI